MIQDDSVSMPNRRTTTAVDHAERVHTALASQAAARQTEQATIPTRRERMYSHLQSLFDFLKLLSFSGNTPVRRTSNW